ncbi:MAG TPA: copper-binding protein [Opitutaceae bacterium]
MKSLVLLSALLLATPAAFAADTKSAPPADAYHGKRHALKGVVTRILADRSALMVKHEDIPGVMRAMTMMFKVDAATLKAAKEGQALTGLMSRQNGEWILEEVKWVEAKK